MMQISSQAIIAIATFAAGVIFGAGVQQAKLARVRKDVNGLGAKIRLLQGLLLRWGRDDEHKFEQITRIVEGKWSN